MVICTFFDEEGDPVIPESMTYSIINSATGAVIRSETVTPTTTSYVIEISKDENTITIQEESRKVIVEWEFNDGQSGDTSIYRYRIKKP